MLVGHGGRSRELRVWSVCPSRMCLPGAVGVAVRAWMSLSTCMVAYPQGCSAGMSHSSAMGSALRRMSVGPHKQPSLWLPDADC